MKIVSKNVMSIVKEITREHSAKSIHLVEVDERTPGKYWVFQLGSFA